MRLSTLFVVLSSGTLLVSAPPELPPCRSEFGPATYAGLSYPLYPSLLDSPPFFGSPWRPPGGRELVVVRTTDNRYGLVDATLEDCDPKGSQLFVNGRDFPALARTGLHSDAELASTKTITGRPVERITKLGLPGALSHSGFLSTDEDVLSVLKGDNSQVRDLGLTHPQLARPLFHVLNAILKDPGLRIGRQTSTMAALYYGGKEVAILARGTKGGQESIFDDGLMGSVHIVINRPPGAAERKWLRERYRHLPPERMAAFLDGLSRIEAGELQPFYIMRYGFYEGHTMWRTSPVSLAFIFGLRTLDELERAFPGRLDRALLDHFMPTLPK